MININSYLSKLELLKEYMAMYVDNMQLFYIGEFMQIYEYTGVMLRTPYRITDIPKSFEEFLTNKLITNG